jgi:4,5-dihydroxyphthalate decarboxylase
VIASGGSIILSYAGWNYFDRTSALIDGSVRPRGLELAYQVLDRAGLGRHLVQNHEFDAGEFWAASFITMMANEGNHSGGSTTRGGV